MSSTFVAIRKFGSRITVIGYKTEILKAKIIQQSINTLESDLISSSLAYSSCTTVCGNDVLANKNRTLQKLQKFIDEFIYLIDWLICAYFVWLKFEIFVK